MHLQVERVYHSKKAMNDYEDKLTSNSLTA
jgi:hypothetical protein